MEAKKIYKYLFYSLVALLCSRHVFQILGFSSIASVMFKLLYVCAFLTLGVCFLDNVKDGKITPKNFMLLIATASVGVVFFVLFFKYPEKLESSATFLITLPLLLCLDTFGITRKESRLYYMLIVPIAISLIVSIFIGSNYKSGVLELYTDNGNQSGLLYMSIFMGIFVYQFLNKISIFMVILEIGLLYGCWLTKSRTAFLACIIMVLIAVFLYLLPKMKKAVLIFAFLVMILTPFLVGPLSEVLDGNIEIMGSSIFTGRENIWPDLISKIFSSGSSPFVFRVNDIAVDKYGKDLGAHNVILDLAWKYTVPVALVFLASLWAVGKHATEYFNDRRSAVLVACMIAAMIHMTMEAAIISGALDYTLYFILNLLCALSMLERKEAVSDEQPVDKCDNPGI